MCGIDLSRAGGLRVMLLRGFVCGLVWSAGGLALGQLPPNLGSTSEIGSGDDFLPPIQEEYLDEEDDGWWPLWRPSLPKFHAPDLTLPKMELPKLELPETPQWVRRMNAGTRQAMTKTRETLTAPFHSDPKPSSSLRRRGQSEQRPGFWTRLFTVEEEPRRPTTVQEFIGSPRPGELD